MPEYVLLTDSDDGTALVACPDPQAAETVAAAAVYSDGGVSAWRVPPRAYAKHRKAAKILRKGGDTNDLHEANLPTVRREAAPVPAPAGSQAVDGTGGLVMGWLTPGDDLYSGGEVPAGRFGMRLVGDYEVWDTPENLGELADRMAARWESPRTAAVNALADMLSQILPGEGIGFASLTCSEADQLARVMVLFGHLDTATNVIEGHCADDDMGDAHGYICALGVSGGDATEAAEVYVRRMMGETDAQPADAAAKREALERLEDEAHQLRCELGMPAGAGR